MHLQTVSWLLRPRPGTRAVLAAAVVFQMGGTVWAAPAPSPSALPPSATALIQTVGLRLEITAVDSHVFHLTASPAAHPRPPISPFVVETVPLKAAMVRQSPAGITVRTAAAELHVTPGGVFTVTAGGTAAVVRRGRFAATPKGVTLALDHDAGQRLYGAGNEDMNVSGDLTHPAGSR